jgi:pentatricopeptide repeat protein
MKVMFQEMVTSKVEMDARSFGLMLQALIHNREVDSALNVWTLMRKREIEPDELTASAMANLYEIMGDEETALQFKNLIEELRQAKELKYSKKDEAKARVEEYYEEEGEEGEEASADAGAPQNNQPPIQQSEQNITIM